MYTTKWSFRLMFLFTLAFLSCESDDSTVPEKRLLPDTYSEFNYSRTLYFDSQYKLIRVRFISQLPNNNWEESNHHYIYNEESQLIESNLGYGLKMLYTLSDDKIVRTDEYINSKSTQYYTFEYTPEGRLAKSVKYQDIPEEGGFIPISGEIYEYDGNGNLKEQRLYYYTTNGVEAEVYTTFTFSGYDDRINGDNMFSIIPINPFINLSKNNPSQMQVKNGNGEVSSTNTYTYQYHKKGHPIKKTTHVVMYNGQEGEYVSNYKFKD